MKAIYTTTAVLSFIVFVAVLVSCAQPNLPLARKEASVYQKVAASAVTVELETAMGSGTVIYVDKARALVLTCAHVVDHPSSILTVVARRGEHEVVLPAQVIKEDKALDLAVVLALGDIGVPAMKIAQADPTLFSKLYTVASPLGLYNTAAPQLFTNKHYRIRTPAEPDGKLVWELTGFAMPGSSGGTVATEAGELTCVIEAIHMYGPFPVSSIVLCVPRPDIVSFLDGYKL